jgi:uncharacterized membrane protein YgaE (UPF0421/DUF939 family)
MNWVGRLAILSATQPARQRLVGGAAQGLMSAAAAILAYLPTKPLGLQEGFWGSITAIAVVQGQLSATQASARDQVIGAAIGSIVGATVVVMAGAQHLAAYALAIVMCMAVCWLLNVPSAARLGGSTVTIIALVPHHSTIAWMMLSRVSEVGWGVAVGIATVWLVDKARGLSGTASPGAVAPSAVPPAASPPADTPGH